MKGVAPRLLHIAVFEQEWGGHLGAGWRSFLSLAQLSQTVWGAMSRGLAVTVAPNFEGLQVQRGLALPH